MITLKEVNAAIHKAVNGAADGLFRYPVPIVAEDLQEPIIRPSIKIAFENMKNGKFNGAAREKKLKCRLYFFAKNRQRPKVENMAMQEAIEAAFLEGLQLYDDMWIPIESVDSMVSDGVLICSFDVYTIEPLPGQPGEMMEELEFREEGV